MMSFYLASGSMPGLFEWCIFGGLVYWLFNERLRAMVDVLSTRMQEVYTRWETRGVPTPHSLRTVSLKPSTPRTRSKELLRTASDRQLFKIKETEWSQLPDRQPRPFMGMSCASCTPSSRSAHVDKNYRNVSVVDVLQVEKLGTHPQTLLAKIFPQLYHALSFKKFHFPYIYETVLNDPKIQDVINMSTRQALEDSNADDDPALFAAMLKRQHERAVKILTALRSTFSDVILRLASYVMNKVMGRLFSRVVVHPAQIATLRKASDSQLPLIFLPLHRSHLDYIVITFILANNNIQSPLVAAGENLRIPVFGWLLRGLGAFFIKRRMDPTKGKKDTLYRALLHTYMMQSLGAGHNFEFFIEGGRTRTGKPCMPKGGLLSVFVDAYMDGTIEDALLVPVSINYERIVDGNFVREQTGQPKEMETFRSAVSSIWSALTSHYGIMRVDFNQPFSLRELVSTFQSKIAPKTNKKKILHSVPSTASLYGTDVVVEEHRQLVDSIARHVVYDCCRSTAVMSTNAVSFLLLNVFREGAPIESIAEALDRLREQLSYTDRDCGFVGDSVDVINHAIDVLGPGLVRRERTGSGVVVTPVTILPNVIELQYYSNGLMPHFVLEAVIGTCIKCLLKESSTGVVYQGQLMSKCVELCEVMQYEFIFTKTCQTLETAISEVIESFLTAEILLPQQKAMLTEEQEWSQRFARHIENNDEYEEDLVISNRLEDLGPEYKVNTDNDLQRLYSVMLQPFIDVYTTTVQNLHRLENRQVPERQLIEDVLGDIRTRLETGNLTCNESVSVDTVRNVLKLVEKWEVVECHNQDGIQLYYLVLWYN
ncbi:glycerol-3-phosphate acyltransferase 1, mitochondrial isoform X4 [Homalodisca vitripennis]|uniref:glycerol-3-phosphate acyltransferase 1, mitochondrial isoform X4 n=1 Tax=Homalodisca vitripennis TaxID=197043 RepID=UPI001EE9FA6E|nr:glycerol-3-phosphate acyltransferase 1, mitochondrial isoform X4 [Homalodisca vitripennis]